MPCSDNYGHVRVTDSTPGANSFFRSSPKQACCEIVSHGLSRSRLCSRLLTLLGAAATREASVSQGHAATLIRRCWTSASRHTQTHNQPTRRSRSPRRVLLHTWAGCQILRVSLIPSLYTRLARDLRCAIRLAMWASDWPAVAIPPTHEPTSVSRWHPGQCGVAARRAERLLLVKRYANVYSVEGSRRQRCRSAIPW